MTVPSLEKGRAGDGGSPRPRVDLTKPAARGPTARVSLSKRGAATPPPSPPPSPAPARPRRPVAPPPVPASYPRTPAPPPVTLAPPPATDRAAPPPSDHRLVLVAVVAVIAVVATVSAVAIFSGGSDSTDATGGGGDLSAARPCPTAPSITVTSTELGSNGLAVDTEVSSPCADGDVITDPSLAVTVSDGQRDVAAGSFDTSSEPLIVPPGGRVARKFVFPAGTYWRTPDGLAGAALTGAATRSGSNSTNTAAGQGASSLTADQAVAPAHGDADAAAATGLRDLADADRGEVSANLADRWVPQISSKRPGLVAEGITWTPQDILREHLELRQQYGSVRLVWSGDWSTFNGPDWWVTVVGDPSSDAASALRWCDRNGRDADHCFAKIISATRGVDGTTVMNR